MSKNFEITYVINNETIIEDAVSNCAWIPLISSKETICGFKKSIFTEIVYIIISMVMITRPYTVLGAFKKLIALKNAG